MSKDKDSPKDELSRIIIAAELYKIMPPLERVDDTIKHILDLRGAIDLHQRKKISDMDLHKQLAYIQFHINVLTASFVDLKSLASIEVNRYEAKVNKSESKSEPESKPPTSKEEMDKKRGREEIRREIGELEAKFEADNVFNNMKKFRDG